MRYVPTSLTVVMVLLLWPVRSSAAPEDPGSFAFKSASSSVTLEGAAIAVDVYWPDAAGSFPVLAVGHGFQRSKASFVEWGQELAKRGYVAVAPNFPGGFAPDHAKNGKIVSGLLAWLVTRGKTAGDPLFGKVDGARRGVVGHSAGGLAALLAAATDPSIKLAVGLDPVDANGLAVAAAPQISAPVLIVRAQPSACNSNGNATDVFAQLTVPRWSLRIKAATHCDPEAPSDFLCGLLCGNADAERHKRFRRYAFAALDHVLGCQPGLEPWLGGAQSQADTLVEDVSAVSWPPAGCASAQKDAAVVEKDGGVDLASTVDGAPDLAGIKDQGSEAPVGGDISAGLDGGRRDAGSTATPEEGCHCSAAAEPNLGVLLGLFLIVLWGGVRRQRGAQRRGAQTLKR